MLQCQVEENQQNITDKETNEIPKKYSCLGNLSFEYKNTEFEKDFIRENCNNWQCHLERISDYIVVHINKWWVNHQDKIEFLDSTGKSRDPNPSHFRSASLKYIELRLQECWEMCLRNDICLPSFGINIDLSLNYIIQDKVKFFNKHCNPQLMI